MLDYLRSDIRYAARMLMKRPGFSVLAILTLSLGIGANTAIFSVVNDVLLRPLPFEDPDRLIKVYGRIATKGWRTHLSYENFVDLREGNRVFSSMSAYNTTSGNLATDRGPERIEYAVVSEDFFSVFLRNPVLGRTFLAEEHAPGRSHVVILSNGLWKRRFAGDSRVLGKDMLLDGVPHIVVAVMPNDFRFPESATALWKPMARDIGWGGSRDSYWLQAVARMKPEVTWREATVDLQAIAGRLAAEYPDTNRDWSVQLVQLHEDRVGQIRKAILMLWGAVGLVLFIACANVANLFLIRAAERKKEIALRYALGGTAGQVFRQLIMECILVGLLAGIGGAVLAFWGVQLLPALGTWDAVQEVRIDRTILLYSLGLSLVTGILFGIAPALQGSRTDLTESLKYASRYESRSHDRAGRMIIVGEIALTFVLLISAALLIQSFIRLFSIDPGFDRRNLLTFRVAPPKSQPQPDEPVETFLQRYRDERFRMMEFYRLLVERIEGLPGVDSAGAIHSLPFAGQQWFLDFVREGVSDPVGEAYGRVVDIRYFPTLGHRVLKGRTFRLSDHESSSFVAVVDDAAARKYWPGQDPVGSRIRFGDDPEIFDWVEIIGVVSNVRNIRIEAEPEPTIYVPMSQAMFGFQEDWGMSLIVRTDGDAASFMEPIRKIVTSMDTTLPAFEMKTMEQVMGDSAAERRFHMVLLSFFSGLALVLAVVGIYGVTSYSVNRRTREIGTRMALGAQSGQVLRMVIWEGMTLTIAGLAVGVALALPLGRMTSSLLFNVETHDPRTLLATALVLIVTSLFACILPAKRAAQVDPIRTLRYE